MEKNKKALIKSADKIISDLNENKTTGGEINENIIESDFSRESIKIYERRSKKLSDRICNVSC